MSRAKRPRGGRPGDPRPAGDASGPERLLATAVAHLGAGRLAEAERLCRRILAGAPDHPKALHLLGVVLASAGRLEEALAPVERALALRPDDGEAANDLGNVLAALGRPEDSVEAYRRAATLAPHAADAQYNLATALHRLGRLAEAIPCYQRAVALDPGHAGAHGNLAQALDSRGDWAAAESHYRRALALTPRSPEACFNLANALHRRLDLGEAEALYLEARAIRPDFLPAILNLATLRQDLGDQEGALALYEDALAIDPASARAHCGIGEALVNQDRLEEADAAFAKALEIDPSLPTALWQRPRLLPVLYETEAEIDVWRARYEAGLAEIEDLARLDTAAGIDAAFAGLALKSNFTLNYQGRDDVELQRRFGAFVHRVAAAKYPDHAAPVSRRTETKARLRVGFASAFLWNHTVGKLFRGWIEGLDPDRFDVHAYHLGVPRDAVTESLERRSRAFFQVTHDFFHRDEGAFRGLAERISSDALDILIYPEIGMDPGTLLLAALRLAPVQAVAWGHPVTSGLPSIDWFLTADLMEPADGASSYTERLARLPNLSIRYVRPSPAPGGLERADFGLAEDDLLYLSCQSLYKYLPQYDAIFTRIAAALSESRFVFIAHPVAAITDKFRRRLGRAFAAAGLKGDRHLHVVPRLDEGAYADLNAVADIYLDTPAWSGGNTTFEAVAAGLPIVTLPGALMRARHSFAILRQAGVEETIADSLDDYVRIAVRLGQEPEWRAEIAAAVAAGATRVFDDREAIGGLQTFLERVARAC